MKVFAIFMLASFIPLAVCMNTAEGFKSVKEQEQVVVPLLSEVKRLLPSTTVVDTSEIMEEYRKALQKTKAMISKTNELTEQVTSGEAEIGDDSDETEMLHCSTANNLRKMIEVNEALQRHADTTVKAMLEQQLTELRESLK